MLRFAVVCSALLFCAFQIASAQDDLPRPQPPEGFHVQLFAKEPDIRNPASMAFDARGRLFVGQGPQFRHPRPDTPGDSVKILIDNDDDGRTDEVKTFAEGFNCIQSLAWKGRDLWVANAPDLTVVRDLDGDDVADEYVLIYTDLGNLEHGLHGLNWAPDGKLYMSKGNSKGHTKGERVAPLPFRELWGVKSPPDAPDFPPPQTFQRGEYKKSYHDPADDWGREGGVLRCDEGGKNLEIVCRGFRNPWDITFDDGFNWLGTDNDQTGGDKIFAPFPGAHFGWGHAWSSNWKGENHPPTVPPSGPLFEGSGTGVVYCASPRYPAKYRGVFFINDWLRHTTYLYRPEWQGALRLPAGGEPAQFITAGKAMYNPTDIEIGPDDAIWVLGWGSGYGARFNDGKQENQGRIWRIWPDDAPPLNRDAWLTKKRDKPHREWTPDELVDDLSSAVPAWRVAAQDELVRRGKKVAPLLVKLLGADDISTKRETWLAWTLGRIELFDPAIDKFFAARAAAADGRSINLQIQAMRVLAHRIRESDGVDNPRRLPGVVVNALADDEPRLRFEAVLAMRQARQKQHVNDLAMAAVAETDPVTFYAIWNTLALLADDDVLAGWLAHDNGRGRRAALLALAERRTLTAARAMPLRLDADQETSAAAALWLNENGRSAPPPIAISPDGGEFAEAVEVQIRTSEKDVEVRYTLDGETPTVESPRYESPLSFSQTTHVRSAMFRDGKRLGPIVAARFRRLTAADLAGRLLAGVKARTGSLYSIVNEGLQPGAAAYTDRQYVLKDIPESLIGATYLRTANGDADTGGPALLTMQAGEALTLYVAHDIRAAAPPAWMRVGQEDGFHDANMELTTSDARHRLYRRDYSAGTIELGGNRDDGKSGSVSHYVVIATPAPIVLRDAALAVDDVLPRVESGDAARGRGLFFSARAGCVRCHRLEERGNEFAPNLADIGKRAKPRHIVESVLAPNAVITEGFISQTIITNAGQVYSGIVLEETDRTLKLAQTDGTPRTLDKSTIDERRTSQQSAMPDTFARYLTPQEVADLTAFLLDEKQ